MWLLAILLWIWVYPDLEAAKEFSSGWIAQVWIINLALLSSIAGGLHLWFIKYNKQNKNLKFDRRDQGKKTNFGISLIRLKTICFGRLAQALFN